MTTNHEEGRRNQKMKEYETIRETTHANTGYRNEQHNRNHMNKDHLIVYLNSEKGLRKRKFTVTVFRKQWTSHQRTSHKRTSHQWTSH